MSAPPIPCVWVSEAGFRPLGRFMAEAERHYGDGEVVTLAPHDERSEVSHRHEFAWLREAWANLPEHIAPAYASAEHLRKRALIATGWCTVQDYVCATKAEAARWGGFLRRELDDYTLVLVEEAVVRVYRAKSQARGKMKAADFQASKTAIIEWVADLIGVSPDQLAARDREAVKNPSRRAA